MLLNSLTHARNECTHQLALPLGIRHLISPELAGNGVMICVLLQDKVASVAMRRSIQGMLEELEPNLWEHVLCRLVDYGHTFSPEIEMAALTQGDELLHGEAVNIDMALTTQVKL